MSTVITTVGEAINQIVSFQTLPSQIDYISPAMRQKKAQAEAFIDKLPTHEKEEAYKQIEQQVNDYYSKPVMGDYTAAQLNEMF